MFIINFFMRFFVAAIVVALLTSCSTFDRRPELATNLIVTYSTLKVIDRTDDLIERQRRANTVESVATSALAVLDGDPEVLITELRAVVNREIPWERLDSGDTLLASMLVSTVTEELRLRTADYGGTERLVKVREVLNYVILAAQMAPPPTTRALISAPI